MKSEARPKTLLVTGTPGTGKTTISKILARELSRKYLGLTNFAKSENLILEKDDERDTLVVDTTSMKKKLLSLIESTNQLIVIDSHFSTDVVASPDVELAIVLRRAPWLLFNELSVRGYDKKKIKENIEAEIVGVCLSSAIETIDSEKILEIDTSYKTPEEVVDIIRLVLLGEVKKSYGKIDWMSHPEMETLLKRL